MKEYQEMLDYQKSVKLSPRFVYSESKKIDGMPRGEGTTIRAAMKVLKGSGVCRERFWPYLPHQTDKPKKGVNPDAKRFRVLTYARILNLDELWMSLATKGPCVIGIEVFNGMMKIKAGVVPMPKKDEETLGGHAICCVGYVERYMMDVWSSVDIEDPNPLTLASVLSYQTRALV